MLSRGRYFIEFFLFSFVTPTLSLFPPALLCLLLSLTHIQTDTKLLFQSNSSHTHEIKCKVFSSIKANPIQFFSISKFCPNSTHDFLWCERSPLKLSIKKNGTKNVTISDKTRAFSKSKYKEKRNKMSAFYYKSPQCSYKNAKRENLKR